MKSKIITIRTAVMSAVLLIAVVTAGCDQQAPVSEAPHSAEQISIYETPAVLNAAIEQKAVPRATLDDSFRDFQDAIDWKRLMKSAVIEIRNGKKELDPSTMLTDVEFAAVQRFYMTTLAWNREEFDAEYGGSFVRLFSEHPDAISCTDFKNKSVLGKVPGPCDAECAGMIVSMAGMFIGSASLVGGAVGAVGFALATEAVGDCLEENNMDQCWGN